MGCCAITHEHQTTGLILPQQQLLISQIEHHHPFSSKSLAQILEAFSAYKYSNELLDSQLALISYKLDIDLPLFFSPSSRYYLYKQSFKQEDIIQIIPLFFSAILLSKGTFEQKLDAILTFSPKKLFKISKIKKILKLLIQISIQKIQKCAGNSKQIKVYFRTLKQGEENFCLRIISLLEPRLAPWSLKHIQKVFKNNSEIQKMLWSQGVRMMLIEQTIRTSNFWSLNPSVLSPIKRLQKYQTKTDVKSQTNSFLYNRQQLIETKKRPLNQTTDYRNLCLNTQETNLDSMKEKSQFQCIYQEQDSQVIQSRRLFDHSSGNYQNEQENIIFLKRNIN